MTQPTASDTPPALVRLFRELRRRRVLRTGAIYVVGAWLMLQVADVTFPGFGIPESAIGALIWAAVAGFPVALLFGWFFDIGPNGIRRTLPAREGVEEVSFALTRMDYLALAAFAAVIIGLLYRSTMEVLQVSPEIAASAEPTADVEPLPRLPNSIAVMPFANISSDRETDYFCDGISEEILNQLAGLRGLNVIGRTSSFAFKDTQVGIARISELLGVQYVLQGSVRKQGDQLRIAAQLLDSTGVQVWAQSFDRALRDIFEIQAEIARSVTGTIASQLRVSATAESYPDIEAYEHFLAGREHLRRRETANSERELRRAIDLDPTFAQAYAELGIVLSMGQPSPEKLIEAREHIDRAFELQPQLLRARAALGLWLQMTTPPDHPASESALRQVLALEPNMTDALLWLSNTLVAQGRNDESAAALERAWRIDPLHPSIVLNLAGRQIERGDRTSGLNMVRRMLEQPAPPYTAFVYVREELRVEGRLVDLHLLARRQLLELHGPHYWSLALSYGLVEDWDRADYWFQRSRRDHPEALPSWFAPVSLMTWQGRFDAAVAEFEAQARRQPGGLAALPAGFSHWLGALHAKAGSYEAAIALLTPPAEALIDSNMANVPSLAPRRALAWAYQHTGRATEAAALLEPALRRCSQLLTDSAMVAADALYDCAELELLGGRREQALDLIARAVTSGWRELYILERDPYWKVLQDEARFREIVAQVRDDVAQQRRQIERLEQTDDFVTKFDRVMAEKATSGE